MSTFWREVIHQIEMPLEVGPYTFPLLEDVTHAPFCHEDSRSWKGNPREPQKHAAFQYRQLSSTTDRMHCTESFGFVLSWRREYQARN